MNRVTLTRLVILLFVALFFWRLPTVLAAIPGQEDRPGTWLSPDISLVDKESLYEASFGETSIDAAFTDEIQPESNQSKELYLPLVSLDIEPQGSLADGWFLMLDDEHIASRDVPRIYHPFQKYPGNPIIVADRPWEGRILQLYGAVFPGFRMWYQSFNKVMDLHQVLYAESTDGLSWNKPDLGGSGSNALFGGATAGNTSVLHTPYDFDKPYKLMLLQQTAFQGYWSTSGIDTTPYPENPLYQNGSDVGHFYWDPKLHRYGGMVKEKAKVAETPRRSVRFIFSDDFIQWEETPDLLTPDALDDQLDPGFYTHFYGLPVFLMGEQYVGLLWVFRARDVSGLIGIVDVQLVSSHDGINWYREDGDRPSILEIGKKNAWDRGQIYTSIQPVHVGHELWLYYSGCNLEHGSNLYESVCSIGLAKAVYDRLASLSGSGTVVTDNMDTGGSALHVNYDARQGSLRVELLRDGEIIPGYEANNCIQLSGDSLDQVIDWSGQSGLPDAPFQIKFYLENSALFAFLIE
jgi:hypothetical protein